MLRSGAVIVVATTLHAYVTDQVDTSQAWLYNAESIASSHPDGVRFFAALETDARGVEPFEPLLARMAHVAGGTAVFPTIGDPPLARVGMPDGADYWTFGFDDGADEITTANRLRRITTGQNMANMYADSVGASHLLFCAADCAPPPDVLPKLLELDHPICGPEIPTYCLAGPEPMIHTTGCICEGTGQRWTGEAWPGASYEVCDETAFLIPRYPFPVQEHMASAACILLAREVFTKLRWRTDRDEGLTDDPALHRDSIRYLGYPTYVRKDVEASHYPEAIGAIETRGHDMKVHR